MQDFESLLKKLGVIDWGYSEELEPHSFSRYESWVERGEHGPLHYLSDYRKEKRKTLESIFPEAKSSLVFLFSYHQKRNDLLDFYQSEKSNGLKVASYVLGFSGRDYHEEVRERLNEIAENLKNSHPNLEVKHSLDIQPVLERDLAYRCGLGWFGKNSMLISKSQGSFFIIGSLILNKKLELAKRELESDHCGQCRACVEACPTQAIDESNRTIIADKCISTYTIELFKDESEPPKGMEKGSGEFFGCDICQDVCPWNKRIDRLGSYAGNSSVIDTLEGPVVNLLKLPLKENIESIEKLSNRGFVREFKGTPLERTGKTGLLKNLKFWLKRSDPDL